MGAPLNRVEAAGLHTIDVTQLLPLPPIRPLDLAQFLEEGLILREKVFRAALAQHDWQTYQDALVPIFVSTEAIVPPWGFLLVGMYLAPYARYYGVGPPEALIERYQLLQLQELPLEPFRDQKILLKGCANLSPAVLTEFFRRVMPVARLVFYGEACSSVPIYKRK